MTTVTINDTCAWASAKPFWIRTNRLLAWSLVISPAAQWACGMRFWTGFWIDMAILFAHAVLSFALFGKPVDRSRAFNFGMHVMGFRGDVLSPRNAFLLTGYRIALGASAILALTYVDNPFVIIVVTILFFYPILRLAYTIIQHVFQASRMALRRWKWREAFADSLAVTITYLYFVISFINMVRG
jgi:hypothetical protein